MALQLKKVSAATLELRGSVGHFWIGPPSGINGETDSSLKGALDVTFFLTYVGLDLSRGIDDQVLNHLVPVREVFDSRDLEFDEVMQRDIDDARVAEELIPYLLDTRTRQLVRFFPPIVVMVLPVSEDGRRPAPYYPAVERRREALPAETHDLEIIQSGAAGNEYYRIEIPTIEDELIYHDLNRLRVNPTKCRLLIVDGQHRAMALLGLHRNLTGGWTDERRVPYRHFYTHWTPEILQNYDLSKVSLPVILCVLPELDENYRGELDLKQAGRSIFLALNKNARKVSLSRNRLLDDNDLIAEFLRALLSEIKHSSSICETASGSIPIWSVELDQVHDRTRIMTESAVTAVNHLYYIIEHLMLRQEDTSGIGRRLGYYGARTVLYLDRIGGRDALGVQIADSTRRDNYGQGAAETLIDLFRKRYGSIIIKLLSNFPLIRAYICAFEDLQTVVRQEEGPQVERLLYGGQGFSSVVSDHVTNLKRRREERDGIADSDAASDALSHFGELEMKRKSYVKRATSDAVRRLVPALPQDEAALDEEVTREITRLFETSRTVAFQAALVLTVLEACDYVARHRASESVESAIEETAEIANDYLGQVSDFFGPDSHDGLSRLLATMRGAGLSDNSYKLQAETNLGFRDVVMGSAELQPDAWTKLRYLFLEIWSPEFDVVADYVAHQRRICRQQIIGSLYRRALRERGKSEGVTEEHLTEDQRKECFEQAFSRLSSLVQTMSGASLSRADMEAAIVEEFVEDPED